MSLHDALIAQLSCIGDEYLLHGIEPQPMGSAHTNAAPHGVYVTKDGMLALGVYTTGEWVRLVDALADARLMDAAFADTQARVANREQLDRIVGEVLAADTTAAWAERLDGAALRWSPVNTVADALELAQVRERELILETRFPSGAEARVIASPFVINGSRSSAPLPAPQLGDDADEGSWLLSAGTRNQEDRRS
jgi:crotonobetainyl-CoA:carnitine CoA-transferase CaiB-like acyl-CoA transferase